MGDAGVAHAQLAKPGVDDPRQRCRLAPLPGMEGGAVAAEHEGQARRRAGGPRPRRRARRCRRPPWPTTGCRARRPPATAPTGASPSWATTVGGVAARRRRPTPRRWCGPSARRARRGPLERVEAPTRMAAVSRASRRGSRSESAAGVIDSTSTPSTCFISASSSSTRSSVGQLDHQLVDGPAGAALEDVDADDVAADGADPAGHLAERSGTVGHPHSEDVGHRHGDHGREGR